MIEDKTAPRMDKNIVLNARMGIRTKKNKRQSFFILILSMINRCTLNRTGQRLTVSIRFKVILGKKTVLLR